MRVASQTSLTVTKKTMTSLSLSFKLPLVQAGPELQVVVLPPHRRVRRLPLQWTFWV